MYGYMGKVLFVDLTSGSMQEEILDENLYRDFTGGIGLGVRVLYERMKPGVDPLGPHNILGLVTGPLTGVGVPLAGRYTVVTKSPLTGTWGDSNSGGYFGPELKAAGYDAVFFTGISPRLVYLFIHDGKCQLKDASHLWGRDTVETNTILCSELGDRTRVACIGPSGESLSLLAAIVNDEGRAAARSGVGAVMGSKNLKAIAVTGIKTVPVADYNRLTALRKGYIEDARTAKATQVLRTYGTPGMMSALVSLGSAPFRNWSLSGPDAMPSYSKLCGDEVMKYQVRKFACAVCPIACGGIVRVESGAYSVNKVHKPEYETLASFGTMCLNDNVESVIKANDICNRYGLDTISAGTAIAFAIECYERGIIGKQETEGLELTWGNAQAMLDLLEKIAKREGFGDILADGVKRASEHIGEGAEAYAIHVCGQELPYHSPVASIARGTGYIVDPTPGRHMTVGFGMNMAEGGRALGPYPELQFTELADGDYQGRGLKYAIASKYSLAISSSGLCLFALLTGTFPFVEFMAAVTGWDFSLSEALNTGHRIQTLRQAFNAREGLRPGDFQLPGRIMGSMSADIDTLKSSYYKAMDWDIETGRPSEVCLSQLGLKEVVGLLPALPCLTRGEIVS